MDSVQVFITPHSRHVKICFVSEKNHTHVRLGIEDGRLDRVLDSPAAVASAGAGAKKSPQTAEPLMEDVFTAPTMHEHVPASVSLMIVRQPHGKQGSLIGLGRPNESALWVFVQSDSSDRLTLFDPQTTVYYQRELRTRPHTFRRALVLPTQQVSVLSHPLVDASLTWDQQRSDRIAYLRSMCFNRSTETSDVFFRMPILTSFKNTVGILWDILPKNVHRLRTVVPNQKYSSLMDILSKVSSTTNQQDNKSGRSLSREHKFTCKVCFQVLPVVPSDVNHLNELPYADYLDRVLDLSMRYEPHFVSVLSAATNLLNRKILHSMCATQQTGHDVWRLLMCHVSVRGASQCLWFRTEASEKTEMSTNARASFTWKTFRIKNIRRASIKDLCGTLVPFAPCPFTVLKD